VPPDVRRQLERSIRDGQKTLKTAIDQLQIQVRRTAKQADVEKALKRLEGLSKQVQQMARDAAARGATSTRRTTRRAATTARRTTRKAATTAKRTAARKPAASRRTTPAAPATPTRKAAARRTPARRTAAPAPEPEQESLIEPGRTEG
jgi:hypothetical protein